MLSSSLLFFPDRDAVTRAQVQRFHHLPGKTGVEVSHILEDVLVGVVKWIHLQIERTNVICTTVLVNFDQGEIVTCIT